ncbi:MAG TPA: diguanylate cyclase [Candidatus Binatia bacterium]|nr:diguanylate cyclase [Candidatus Binatia bacterium]
MAPFVLLAVAGGVSVLGNVDGTHLPSLAVAVVAAVGAGIAALRLPLGRRHELLGLVSPLLQLAAVAFLRDATGAHASGVEPLAFLPIMWIAIHGSRAQLVAGAIALFVADVVPVVAVGPPTYHPEIWQPAGIRAVIAGGIGWTVQALLDRLHARSRQLASAEAALRQAYARLRPLVDVADVAVVTFDAAGRILEWNPGAARLFGWSAAEAAERDVFALLVPPERREEFRRQLERLIERPEDVARRLRTELRAADGTRIPVTLELIVATVGGRRLVYGVATDRRSQEAAEQAAREHLEDLTELLGVVRDLAAPESDRVARERLCETALRLSGASIVVLYEPSADGRSLDPTAQCGRRLPSLSVRLRGEPSGTALAYHTGQPLFVPDLTTDPRVSPRLVAVTGMRAGYFLPILRAGRPTGVLVVLWEAPRPELSARRQSLLGLFASLAAVIIERADLTRRLDELARTDPLTGLPNRRELDDVLERELALARRRAEPLSLAVADLDHFKAYNDRFGHQAGDALLAAAAAAWRSAVRATDTVARFGGEEFVIVMPGAGSEDAVAVAERIRAATPPEVTVSIGVATWDGRESAAELLRRADVALFEAKAAGRNRVVAAPGPVREGGTPGTEGQGNAGERPPGSNGVGDRGRSG